MTKQSALKVALFTILAANVAGNYAGHTKDALTFRVSELASGAPEVGVARAAAPAAPAAPARELPTITVESAPQTVVAPTGPQPDPNPNGVAKRSSEKVKVCGEWFQVRYEQKAVGANTYVYGKVTRLSDMKSMNGLRQVGTYESIIDDADVKSQWDDKIESNIVDTMTHEGKTCEPSAVASRPSGTRPSEDDIKRDNRLCELNRDGSPMKNAQRYECNLARLESIDLSKYAGDEDTYEETRRSRSDRDRRSAGISEIEDALSPLENSLKFLLTVDEDDMGNSFSRSTLTDSYTSLENRNRLTDKRDIGLALLDKVVRVLNRVRSTARSTADSRAVARIIARIDKGYRLGAKVDFQAATYEIKINDLNTRFSKVSQTPPDVLCRQTYLPRQAIDLCGERAATMTQVNSNRDYLNLRDMVKSNVLPQEDFADFTSDYNTLLQNLYGVNVAGASSNTIIAPPGAADARNQLAQNDPRALGLQTPSFPQIDYRLLGLQNPNLAGGQAPAFQQQPGVQPIQQPIQQGPNGFPVNTFQQQPLSIQQPGVPYQQQPGLQQQPGFYQQQAQLNPQLLNQQAGQSIMFPAPGSIVPGRTN